MRLPRIEYCRECALDFSLPGFLSKVLVTTALVVGCIAFAQPHSAEGNYIRIEDLQRRVEPLEGMVSQVAELKAEVARLSLAVDAQTTQEREVMAAIIMLLATKLLGAFGITLKRKGE